MTLPSLSPAETAAAIKTGARLIDIRTTDEHARDYIASAVNLPLDRIGDLLHEDRPVIFHCKSGMRTASNVAQLAAAAGSARAYIMDGGIDAWRAGGLPTVRDSSLPLEIMRQVQITAGTLVLAGLLLGLFISPAFFGVSAFVGAGLAFAGITGWCGMARMLGFMPWNRPAAT